MIGRSAAQRPLYLRELHRKDEARPGSDPPFLVYLDEEVPTLGAELDSILSNAANPGARARMIEPQLAPN